jgi:glycine oxidase
VPAPIDVLVAGGGVVGLSIAWRAAERGHRVTVVDPAPGTGASAVAAGMLAPVSEAAFGEEPLLELALCSARLWPDFARDLAEASKRPSGFVEGGTLVVGLDGSDRAALVELHRFQTHLGLDVDWCTGSRCRELEPLLAPGVRGGVLAPSDHQVDNRCLVAALLEACRVTGVELVADTVVSVVRDGAGRAAGVRCSSGTLRDASAVVLCLGSATAELSLEGLDPGVLPPIRPVKGQILRLFAPDGAPTLVRTVRALVSGRFVYLVPRPSGELVIGATSEERRDLTVTAGAVLDLLADAQRIVPVIGEYELLEARAGLRPAAPDNLAVIGESGIGSLLLATGHYRHGVLLSPITAAIICDLLDGEPHQERFASVDPRRFRTEVGATAAASHSIAPRPSSR